MSPHDIPIEQREAGEEAEEARRNKSSKQKIADALRAAVHTLRRSPMPLADMIPMLQRAADALSDETAAPHPDTERLSFLESECAELRCIEERGPDDADLHYEVRKFFMQPPRERAVGMGTGPREAIDAAMNNDDDECCFCGQERNCGICSPLKTARDETAAQPGKFGPSFNDYTLEKRVAQKTPRDVVPPSVLDQAEALPGQ